MLRTLGKGSFGKVKEALHVLSDQKIAVKILEKDRILASGDEIRVQREIDILQKVQHPNVIQVYEIVETSKYYFFLMENCTGGELSTLIENRGK
jgi:5'-AMP-activated protein kinase catalytic alpha subunit